MLMSRSVPEPAFTWMGFSGGVSAIEVLQFQGESCIAIGTQEGILELYDEGTKLRVVRLYEDSEKRSIVSCGLFRGTVFAHVRTHAVLQFPTTSSGDYAPKLLCPTFHYAHCAARHADGKLIVPDMKGGRHCMRIIEEEEGVQKEVNLEEETATPMCFDAVAGAIFVAFDDGRVDCYKELKKVFEVSVASEPIFSLRATSTLILCGSSKAPLHVFSCESGEHDVDDGVIPYIESACGCSSLAVSPSGKTIFASFWDGSLRAFSLRKRLPVMSVMVSSPQNLNVVLAPRDRQVYTGDAKGVVHLWNL